MSRRLFTCLLVAGAFALAALPAHADRDAVQFFSDIDVPPGATVHDAVCFFCSVNVEGTADNDIVVFFGNVHIASHANHDVVSFFGNVRADDNATISHDLVNFFGMIRLGHNVSVGNDMVAMFSGVSAPGSVSVGGDRVFQPGWVLLIPLCILGCLFYFLVSVVRNYRYRQMMANYPFPPPPPHL